MTDRETLIAIFKGIAQIYHELTGAPLCVDVETAHGRIEIQNFGGTTEARKSCGITDQAA